MSPNTAFQVSSIAIIIEHGRDYINLILIDCKGNASKASAFHYEPIFSYAELPSGDDSSSRKPRKHLGHLKHKRHYLWMDFLKDAIKFTSDPDFKPKNARHTNGLFKGSLSGKLSGKAKHHVYPIREMIRFSLDYIFENRGSEKSISYLMDIAEKADSHCNEIGKGFETYLYNPYTSYKEFVKDMLSGNLQHPEDYNPGYEADWKNQMVWNLIILLGWQVWNIVLGPRPENRKDDPGETFDAEAALHGLFFKKMLSFFYAHVARCIQRA